MTKLECHNEIETQTKYRLWRIEQGLSQQERQAFVADFGHYGGGTARKKAILGWEAARVAEAAA